ncbi:DUF6193 family natural product biosynthesis protein [Streptomyces violascens]|uniref:DUF6193 family natural product biosynthesis protein n=1 Tax=Streptomyces violascens TaxID=67381 RepID=UPI003665BEA6
MPRRNRPHPHDTTPTNSVAVITRDRGHSCAGSTPEAPDFPEFGALVEAAHAERRLRELYVFSSHWTLGFSSCTGFPFQDEVAIAPSCGGSPYRVLKHPHADVISEAATAEEAVALAVTRLPAALGPAVTGTAKRKQ